MTRAPESIETEDVGDEAAASEALQPDDARADMRTTDGVAAAGGVVHEEVYARLRDALVSGRIEPGRAISVRRLAAEFGVSAMPAREAIRRLVANGAFQLTDTRRVRVADMSRRRAEDLRIARLAVEPALAARALEVVDECGDAAAKKRLVKTLREIDAELADAVKQGDAERYTHYNNAYHFTLYSAAESDVLMGLVETLWLQIGPFMRVVIGQMGTRTFMRDHHVRAVDAFESSDAEALSGAIRGAIRKSMDILVGAGDSGL